MGCDGGTIPKRDELVRTKKKQEQKDRRCEAEFRWRCCSISQAELERPVVACSLGRLYSKTSVISALLDHSLLPTSASHIKSLKDVCELKLTDNVEREGSEENWPYICPLTGLEMNGKFKFCFPWTCGCVISERAFRQLKASTCPKCEKVYSETDTVVLNAAGEELDLMKVRMEARQARAAANKKAKKAAKLAVKAELNSEEGVNCLPEVSKPSSSTLPSSSLDLVPKEIKTEPTSRGVALQTKLTTPSHGVSSSLKRGECLSMQGPDLKKAKSDYSVARDPQASNVYKSIFTSSTGAKAQDRAHWVTYNPFYN